MIEPMFSAGVRIGKRDVAISVVASLLGLLLMYDNVWGGLADERADPNSDAHSASDVVGFLPVELAAPLFLLITVPLLWRRLRPIAAVGAALAGLVVNDVLTGTDFLRCGVLFPTGFLFAFTAGAQLDRGEARTGLGLSLALVLLDAGLTFGAPVAAVAGGVTAAVWGIGRVVRSRRLMAEELRAHTTTLRGLRDERARMEVAADRARLSGELDALLQRRLGELARLAGEGAAPGDPTAATATLAEIERQSRSTLEEMRALVGVLRDDDAPSGPQPTLTHLEALVVQAKGTSARLIVEGGPRVLPAGVELSAYRIVEHLLEALDDAPDVNVRVRFGDDALELAVSGRARRTSKASIEQARERARLERGTLEATMRGGRAEAVVSLPVFAVA
jgi:signal transduction histidine kinase